MGTAQQLNSDTLDFIYQHTKGATEAQSNDIDALNTKATQTFLAGSIVVGLAGVALPGEGNADYAVWMIVAAIAVYVALAITAYFPLRISRFRHAFYADVLWPQYGGEEAQSVKHLIVSETSQAYKENKDRLFRKGDLVRIALALLAVQVSLSGAALVLSVLV